MTTVTENNVSSHALDKKEQPGIKKPCIIFFLLEVTDYTTTLRVIKHTVTCTNPSVRVTSIYYCVKKEVTSLGYIIVAGQEADLLEHVSLLSSACFHLFSFDLSHLFNNKEKVKCN